MSAKVILEILNWADYFLTGGRMPRPEPLEATPEITKMVSRYEQQIEKLESDMRNLDLHRAALEGENKELNEKFHKVKEANVYLADRLVNRESEIGKILGERNELDRQLKMLPASMQAQLTGRHEVSTDDERPEYNNAGRAPTGAKDPIHVECSFCHAPAYKPCRFPSTMAYKDTDYHASRIAAAKC